MSYALSWIPSNAITCLEYEVQEGNSWYLQWSYILKNICWINHWRTGGLYMWNFLGLECLSLIILVKFLLNYQIYWLCSQFPRNQLIFLLCFSSTIHLFISVICLHVWLQVCEGKNLFLPECLAHATQSMGVIKFWWTTAFHTPQITYGEKGGYPVLQSPIWVTIRKFYKFP